MKVMLSGFEKQTDDAEWTDEIDFEVAHDIQKRNNITCGDCNHTQQRTLRLCRGCGKNIRATLSKKFWRSPITTSSPSPPLHAMSIPSPLILSNPTIPFFHSSFYFHQHWVQNVEDVPLTSHVDQYLYELCLTT